MLKEALDKNASMAGRSANMKVTATGEIVDAYDMYIKVYGRHRPEDSGMPSKWVEETFMLRFLYWKTTHKKILFGSVVVQEFGMSPELLEEVGKIAAPVEIKDYWKRAFERQVVVSIQNLLCQPKFKAELEELRKLGKGKDAKEDDGHPINEIIVRTFPLAAYEACRIHGWLEDDPDDLITDVDERPEGQRGYVRSDDPIIPTCTLPISDTIQ